jgi:hypothetical protein
LSSQGLEIVSKAAEAVQSLVGGHAAGQGLELVGEHAEALDNLPLIHPCGWLNGFALPRDLEGCELGAVHDPVRRLLQTASRLL